MKPDFFKDVAFLGGGWAAAGLLEAARLTLLGSLVFGFGLVMMHYRHAKARRRVKRKKDSHVA